METRICDECGKEMTEGFVVFSGDEYYCSKECLHEHYTDEEFEDIDDSYWTSWN